jgi:hypothetical protein
LFAVLSPRRGGRLVALFGVEGTNGVMVVGNPSDDWHFKEELNDYMDQPPNHPGALADVGFEHDAYSVEILVADGLAVAARLRNVEPSSAAFGLEKTIYISSYGDSVIRVDYDVPSSLDRLGVEFALSPDYFQLLRCGSSILTPYERGEARGCMSFTTAVWVKPEFCATHEWTAPYQENMGHGRALRLSVGQRRFAVSIGVEQTASLRQMRALQLRLPYARSAAQAAVVAAAEQEATNRSEHRVGQSAQIPEGQREESLPVRSRMPALGDDAPPAHAE